VAAVVVGIGVLGLSHNARAGDTSSNTCCVCSGCAPAEPVVCSAIASTDCLTFCWTLADGVGGVGGAAPLQVCEDQFFNRPCEQVAGCPGFAPNAAPAPLLDASGLAGAVVLLSVLARWRLRGGGR
jgi:hypothetical protein